MRIRLPFLLLAAALVSGAVLAQSADTLNVFKNPYCGCCGKWIEHMQKAGFKTRIHEVNDASAARKKLGMPEQLASCHSSRIGDYVVEGHVPAADIQRLLKEKPKALGLAVPGMPADAPGMASATPEPGAKPIPYDTLLVQADGRTRIFARH